MLLNNFSHIYVEESAREYELTDRLCQRFDKARTISINSYKDVFNRPQQDWQLQKNSQKLILAKKNSGLIYPGSPIAPSFGQEHFYYNSLVLNCLFNCSYCYLQGMYPSANIVLFVNQEDFINAARDKLSEHGSLYLCISYDTDLLGFENLFELHAPWIKLAEENSNLLIESRTKSSNFKPLTKFKPADNFIIAWTLSPKEVQKRFENQTPPLESRLKALKAAVEAGWPVRICLDPIVIFPGWEQAYSSFLEELKDQLPLKLIRDFSVGMFRMNQDFLRRIQRQNRESSILYHDFEISDSVAGYSKNDEDKMKDLMTSGLSRAGVAIDRVSFI